MNFLLRFATNKLLIKIAVQAAELLAKRTNTTVDDDVVKAIKEVLGYE